MIWKGLIADRLWYEGKVMMEMNRRMAGHDSLLICLPAPALPEPCVIYAPIRWMILVAQPDRLRRGIYRTCLPSGSQNERICPPAMEGSRIPLSPARTEKAGRMIWPARCLRKWQLKRRKFLEH